MTLSPASALQPTRLALTAHVAPEDAGGVASGPPSDQIPTTGADLTQLAQEQYNLDVSAAVTLGFSVVSLKADAKHDVLVYQVARYKDVSDAKGETYRFGIAVEATIQVTVDHFEGGLTLPTVAANVQLGYSSASSDLAVRGYAFSHEKAVTVPPWGSFSVDSYAAFEKSIDEIVAAVLFDNDKIRPVLLATTTPPINSADTTPPQHRFFYKLGEALHR
ncbi:MAG TPA: hypothetical protein VIH71_12710 [Solirubrobacteraceae bacterium]